MARKDLLALLAVTFLYMVGRSIVAPVSPAYFQAVHVDILSIGVLLGGFGFAFLVSEAVWGIVSSRVWSRWTFLALILVSGLLPLPMSRPQPFEVLLAIQIASGLCLGGMGVLPRLLVPSLADPESKARSFGYLGLVFSFGTMAGSLLGGAVYGAVGLSTSFIVAALVSMSPVLPLWFLRFGRGAGSTVSPTPEGAAGASHQGPLLALPELLALGLVGLATAASSIFYNLLLPNILARDQSYSATVFDISLVIALFSLSSGAFQPVMGLRGSRSPRRWISTALVACGLTFAMLVYSSSMIEIYFIAFLAGIAASAITPLALSVLSGGVQPSRLGRVFGLYGASENTGLILGALAGGFVWADFGATSVFLAMAILFISIGVVYGVVSRRAIPRA